MTRALEAYGEYKDSGVKWLGEVPAHWKMRKLRQCASISGGMTPSMDDGRFWNGDVPWVTPKDMKTMVIGDSRVRVTDAALAETALRLVQAPAVLMVVRGMILARRVPIATTSVPVTINQDMKALRPSPALNAAYMASFLRCAHDGLFPLIDEAGHGTRRLPTERWRDLPLTLPPLAEQTAIARFLDYIDRHIRRAIRKKEKLIGLLEEQQQAIVHQAVTGQIDVRTGQPYPAYRESEVEWLTEVPAHWPELALGTASNSIQTGPFGSQLHADEYIDGGVPVINPSHLSEGRIAPDRSIAVTGRKAAELSRHRLATGDVVIARRGEVGRSALVRSAQAGWICGTGSLRLRPRKTVCSPDYLLLVLNSSGTRDALELASVGSTMSNLNAEIVSRLRVCLPPPPEQVAIAQFCWKVTDRHAAAIDRTHRHIALLSEFRARMTADAVTGKLDVRDAAVAPP